MSIHIPTVFMCWDGLRYVLDSISSWQVFDVSNGSHLVILWLKCNLLVFMLHLLTWASAQTCQFFAHLDKCSMWIHQHFQEVEWIVMIKFWKFFLTCLVTLYPREVLPHMTMIRRFLGDDCRFWDFQSDWVPMLFLITIWLTPFFRRKKNQFVSITFSSRNTKVGLIFHQCFI